MYFSALKLLTLSRTMNRVFPGRYRTVDSDEDVLDCHIDGHISQKIREKARSLIVVFILPVIWLVVRLGEAIESRTEIAGIGIAINSALSCVIPATFLQLIQLSGRQRGYTRSMIVAEIQNITTNISDLFFYMLLSVIGSSTSRLDILDRGWQPTSSFIFTFIALFVHLTVIIFGSLGMTCWLPQSKQFPLRTEEIAVASCAAIVGPQAAASLAVKMSFDKRNTTRKTVVNWRGLAFSGTVLGVIGYIISCPIGVMLSKCLMHFLSSENHLQK